MKATWATIKNYVDSKNLQLQYVESDNWYHLKVADGSYIVEYNMDKDPSDTTDLDDFEANYKANSNQPIEKLDSEGHREMKKIVSLDAFHYEPRSLDFETSKLGSLYNRKHDNGGIYAGTDYNDATLHFYNSSDVELVQGAGESDVDFQTRLTSGCVKTVMYFTPTFRYAIRSGVLMLREEWTYDGYVWCMIAPHLPEAVGGQAPFLSGGYNMRFFPAKSYIRMDGESTFTIEQDTTYYSHRIGLVVKHTTGDQKGIQMIYELYKE